MAQNPDALLGEDIPANRGFLAQFEFMYIEIAETYGDPVNMMLVTGAKK